MEEVYTETSHSAHSSKQFYQELPCMQAVSYKIVAVKQQKKGE